MKPHDANERLSEIRGLWDQVLEVEDEIENLKKMQKEKKDAREALLQRIKEAVYDNQARLELEGEA